MLRTANRSALIASVALACASTPNQVAEPSPSAAPQAATSSAFNPVGTYTFAADVQGTTREGTLEISRGEQGGLVGAIHADQTSIPISAVAVEGRTMRFSFIMPDGPEVMFVMEFQGDNFTGTWSAEGTSGSLYGARKRG